MPDRTAAKARRFAEAERASIAAEAGSTAADEGSEACPTTPKDQPGRGVLHGPASGSDRPAPVGERQPPGPPIGPAPKPFDFLTDEPTEQATEPVGREEQSAAGMDVDDTADTAFDKVGDDTKSKDTDPDMGDMVDDSSENEKPEAMD